MHFVHLLTRKLSQHGHSLRVIWVPVLETPLEGVHFSFLQVP